MDAKVLCGLAGGLAGVIRVVKGFGFKKLAGDTKQKKEKLNWKKATVSIIEALVIGIATGFVVESPIVAFMSGLGISSIADINKFIKW